MIKKLFLYDQSFALHNIVSNFLFVFDNSYLRDQLQIIEYLHGHNKSIEQFEDKKKKFRNDLTEIIDKNKFVEVSKQISSSHFSNKKEFTDYELARLYFYLPLFDTKLSKIVCSFILSVHLTILKILKDKNQYEINLSNALRFFVHFIEIIHTFEKLKIKEIINDTRYPLNVLELLANKKIYGIETKNKEKFSFTIGINEENHIGIKSLLKVNVNNLLESSFDEIKTFENLANYTPKKRSFTQKKYTDTTKENAKHLEETSSHGVSTSQYIIPDEDLPINDEEKAEQKISQAEFFREKSSNKERTTKKQQHKQIKSKSAAIAKSKLMLPSLYRYPTVFQLSNLLSQLIISVKLNRKYQIQDDEDFYKIYFLTGIILGISTQDIEELLKHSDYSLIERKLNKKLFANYEQFNDSIGIKTQEFVNYKVPMSIELFLNCLKTYNKEISFERFRDVIEKYVKGIDRNFTINFNHIWNTMLVHQKIFDKSINTQSLLATNNIDQNNSPIIKYTLTSSNLAKHSHFLKSYLNKLEINDLILKKFTRTKVNRNSDYDEFEEEYVGSRKLIHTSDLTNFFNQMKQAAKNEKNKLKKFNLYSLYVRFALSLLCGTRDFEKSVNLSKVSLLYKIYHIQEKGHYENTGHRVVPLCNSAATIIEKYFAVLKEYEIDAKRIVFLDKKQKIYDVTLSNIRMIYNDFFLNEHDEIFNKIESIALNVGRHTIVTLASDASLDKDKILAFMGHSINGSESLGILSMLDSNSYSILFRNLLEDISKIYFISEISHDIGI